MHFQEMNPSGKVSLSKTGMPYGGIASGPHTPALGIIEHRCTWCEIYQHKLFLMD
jgi:hypothetical protein